MRRVGDHVTDGGQQRQQQSDVVHESALEPSIWPQYGGLDIRAV